MDISAIALVIMFAYAIGYMVYDRLEDNRVNMNWTVEDEYHNDNNRRGL